MILSPVTSKIIKIYQIPKPIHFQPGNKEIRKSILNTRYLQNKNTIFYCCSPDNNPFIDIRKI